MLLSDCTMSFSVKQQQPLSYSSRFIDFHCEISARPNYFFPSFLLQLHKQHFIILLIRSSSTELIGLIAHCSDHTDVNLVHGTDMCKVKVRVSIFGLSNYWHLNKKLYIVWGLVQDNLVKCTIKYNHTVLVLSLLPLLCSAQCASPGCGLLLLPESIYRARVPWLPASTSPCHEQI